MNSDNLFIDKQIKYHFLLNGVKYKTFNKMEKIIFLINYLNIIFVYSCIILNHIYSKDYYKIKIIYYPVYFSDIILLIYSNNLQFKKNISRQLNSVLEYKSIIILSRLLKINLLISLIASLIGLKFKIKFFILHKLNTYIFLAYSYYSINFKLNICILFFVIMNNILTIFSEFINQIKKDNNDINNLIIHYLEIRHIYNKIITCYNFNISLILSIYYIPTIILIVNFDIKYNYYFYLNIILYILFLSFFQFILSKFDNLIDHLKYISDKGNNLYKQLKRNKTIYKVTNEDESSENLIIKTYLLNLENGNIIDWHVFSNILNQPLKCFDIFGVNIENSNIVRQLITYSILIIFSRKILL